MPSMLAITLERSSRYNNYILLILEWSFASLARPIYSDVTFIGLSTLELTLALDIVQFIDRHLCRKFTSGPLNKLNVTIQYFYNNPKFRNSTLKQQIGSTQAMQFSSTSY